MKFATKSKSEKIWRKSEGCWFAQICSITEFVVFVSVGFVLGSTLESEKILAGADLFVLCDLVHGRAYGKWV